MTFPNNKKIILFDGHCNLCSGAVQFLIKNDKYDTFRFASLQSESGNFIFNHIGLDATKIDSIVLYIPNVVYYIKSDAALEIANDLNVFYQLLGMLKIFPKKIRDLVYDYIAKNRYKWFGKTENCMMPTPEIQSKFLL
ncbi:MAG: hypothetical protein RLZZ312_1741 [Bacteroidota bacterium]|jgi:predicted DCC family thiol-disulfide oxidoreductase YuxK